MIVETFTVMHGMVAEKRKRNEHRALRTKNTASIGPGAIILSIQTNFIPADVYDHANVHWLTSDRMQAKRYHEMLVHSFSNDIWSAE